MLVPLRRAWRLPANLVLIVSLMAALGGATSAGRWQVSSVDDARLANADADRDNWLTNGRTYSE